jgi:tripartite-type tricarboxylate transporter receptor subunit TctC
MNAGRPAIRTIAGCIVGFAVLLGLASTAQAQGAPWPNRPIRFIVPFPPGGPTDAFVRAVANPLGQALGQPVVVENRAGGGGSIGVGALAKAAPDGYTMSLGAAGALMALPHLMKLPYSVQNDITYVSGLAEVPEVIAVSSKSGINTLAELIARAKREPGKLNYASAGTGTLVHLVGELFKRETGTDIVHVPYNGAAPALTNLLGGQVESIVSDLTPLVPQMQAGTVKVLAVTSTERTSVLPNVPTVAELGYPKVVYSTIYGVIMPAGVPQAIVDRVQRELSAILKSPDVKETYAQMGSLASPSTPAQYRQYVLSQYESWGRFIKESGITLN